MQLSHRLRQHPARGGAVIGAAGVMVVCAVGFAIRDRIGAEIPALLLLVPIVVAALLAGWRIAVAIASVAGVANSLLFLEPFGAIRVGFTQDVVTFVTFVAVAATVSWIVGRRVPSRTDADDARLMLLRGVGHDLRSPLHTIRLASSDLLDDDGHDERSRAELLGVVLDESVRMERIVANLLSLSRVQAGALQPDLRPLPLAALVEDCRSRFERLHAGSVVVGEIPVADVVADAVQIDQVLTNLIENARRVAPPTMPARISAVLEGRRVTIHVDDDGPGFATLGPVTEAPHTSTTGSSGLGLVVSSAIVEAHGGTLLRSVSPSGGARVSFDLAVAG